MVAKQHDDIITSDIDMNHQGSEMCLCAKFGHSTHNGLEGIFGQRSKQTHRLTENLHIIVRNEG